MGFECPRVHSLPSRPAPQWRQREGHSVFTLPQFLHQRIRSSPLDKLDGRIAARPKPDGTEEAFCIDRAHLPEKEEVSCRHCNFPQVIQPMSTLRQYAYAKGSETEPFLMQTGLGIFDISEYLRSPLTKAFMVEIDFHDAVEAFAGFRPCEPAVGDERAVRKYLPKLRFAAEGRRCRVFRHSYGGQEIHDDLIGCENVLNLPQIPAGYLAQMGAENLRNDFDCMPTRSSQKVQGLSTALAGIDGKQFPGKKPGSHQTSETGIGPRERAKWGECHDLVATQQTEARDKIDYAPVAFSEHDLVRSPHLNPRILPGVRSSYLSRAEQERFSTDDSLQAETIEQAVL